MSPSIVPGHPFNSNKKIFTDENSISLMLRLINVFNQPKMEFVYADPGDWDPPIDVIDRNNKKLSYIVAMIKPDEFNAFIDRLNNDLDVVAIFYHEALDKKEYAPARMVYALMKDQASANRLAGI